HGPAARLTLLPVTDGETFAPGTRLTASFRPLKLLTTWLLAMCAAVTEPLVTVAAMDAHKASGPGATGCRGVMMTNAPTFVRTWISRKRSAPEKTAAPKSTETLNKPPFTVTAAIAGVLVAMAAPPVALSKSKNCISAAPL